MSTELKREYLRNIRQRYNRGSKMQRTLILDDTRVPFASIAS
ncbi:MAG: hypothetical protein AB7N80_03440 [Bdellovibrionales bacterium]